MLIQNNSNIKTGDVVCFKIVSGEEVIARVKTFDPLKITVAKPVTLQMQMVGPGQMGVGFAPFMVSADDTQEITFPRSAMVVEPIVASKQVMNGYTKATSNIEIAPAIPTASLG